MLTICIMPNFKGTLKEKSSALWTCLLIDSIYIIPLIVNKIPWKSLDAIAANR